MTREEMLRFFKQWSNEDRNVAANVATMLALNAFWKPSPQSTDIQGYADPDPEVPEDHGHSVSFEAGRITFRPGFEPTGAQPCEGGWQAKNGWSFVPLSRSRSGVDKGRTKTQVAAVVVCATDGCSQQWLAHAGPCD